MRPKFLPNALLCKEIDDMTSKTHDEWRKERNGLQSRVAELVDVNQDEGYERLKARNAQLEADLRQMKEAIYWALGERDDFPPEPEPIAGKYRKRYWWRTELRKRSGLPIGGVPQQSETSAQREVGK
jgi:hypothetical protein